ncbi:MAG: T9SS type A sorting domain-containing protein [Candidatus Neomarinimicrobiota bacterium]
MKKWIIAILGMVLTGMLWGQLFFSEYIEGSGSNKALEIYNASETDTISLHLFRIAIAQNGRGWNEYHYFPGSATLAPGDVWVMLADEANPALFAYEDADEIIPWSAVSPVHFNGNDARGLEALSEDGASWVLIDIIGDPENDPGDSWSVAGRGTTKDFTLVRKAGIMSGNTDWPSSAGTDADNSEWEVYPNNTFLYLGEHPSVTEPPAVTEVFSLSDLRALPEGSPALYSGQAQVTFAQAWRGQKFIQDESAAILIDDNAGNISTAFISGDGITGISGSLSSFGNMLQYVPSSDALTTDAPPIAVQTISLPEFKNNFEAYESELIKLENVRFIDADGMTTIENGGVYPITDGVDTVLFRASFYGVEYIGDTIPSDLMNITGIANARSEGYYITARGYSDFYIHGEEGSTFAVTFWVDMSTHPEFDPSMGKNPMITGSFCGWATPGGLPEQQTMEMTGEGLIYRKTLELEAGNYQYKYFVGSGWDGGEWAGEPNRQIDVVSTMEVSDIWGQLLPPDNDDILSGGSGTMEDPYLVATAQDLDSVRHYMAEGVYFRQIADIDLGLSPWSDGEGWVPIGTYPDKNMTFKGHYDGNNHAVNNLTMSSTAEGYKGLFGANDGNITSLRVENAMINDHGSRCGILVGLNFGSIEYCSSSGTISTDHSGGRIGGLCAWNEGMIIFSYSVAHVTLNNTEGSEGLAGGLLATNMGSVSNCCATGTVSGNYYTGGLVGWNGGTIRESYAAGDMVSGYISSGGLVGLQRGGQIINCYATKDVECSYNSGGLVGLLLHGEINNSYSLGEVFGHSNKGGLVGYAYGHTLVNSYWDMDCSRIRHSAAGEGKSSNEMLTDHSIYAAWNTDIHWSIGGFHYPYLQWQRDVGGQNLPQDFPSDYWVVFHLDMNNIDGFDPYSDKVYISGNMHGEHMGLYWPEPGSYPSYEMQYVSGGLWTLSMRLMPGSYEYKFYSNAGWEGGEWDGEPNRCMTVGDFTVLNDVWSILPDTVSSDLHYAHSVIAFSSEAHDSTMFPGAWSAQQVLGPPDAYPYYDNKNGLVWNPETADDQREFIELGFETPVYASGVMIYETYGAGAVDSVYVRNADDASWHNVWSGDAGRLNPISRIFPVMFEATAFKVDAVRLAINSPAVSGYHEYDAVALVENTEPEISPDWAIRLGVSRGEHHDPENYLGVSRDALDTFDDRDLIEAPAAPETQVALYFPHPEWEHPLGNNFCADFRLSGQAVYVWNFEVYSADTGTVLLDAKYFSVPVGLPVLLEDMHDGRQQILHDAGRYSYHCEAGETRTFSITVGDTTEPVLVLGESCSGPRILKAGEEHLLEWSITGSFDLRSVEILLSRDDAIYEGVTTLGKKYDYTWTLPDVMLVREAKLWFIAVSNGGDTLMATSEHPFTIAGDRLEVDIPAGWSLLGIPILPDDNSMSNNLSDDFTDYYVVYDYFNGHYRFADVLKEASGYWLGLLSAGRVDVEGEPLTEAYDLALESGWNLVSNPLLIDVDVDSLLFKKGEMIKTHREALTAAWINSIYACDAPEHGYYVPEAMEFCRGYWLSVLTEDLWVQFPLHRKALPLPALLQKKSSTNALIDFIAESGTQRNDMLRIGILPEASSEFDPAFDAIAPPTPPSDEYLELYVPRPDLTTVLGNHFVRDIRGTPTEVSYEEWKIKLNAGSEPITLSWSLGTLPEGMQASIALEGEAEFRDMETLTEITITNAQNIIVRMGINVVGIANEMIPSVYILESNYPNPFNPSTTISYALPEVSKVNLSIYDLNGRLVRTLVNAEEGPGYKQLIWNGRNDAGDALSSGVYLYRLEAGEFIQTRKMLFLK